MTYVLAENEHGSLAELAVDRHGRGTLTTWVPAFQPHAGECSKHRLSRALTARIVAEVLKGADRDTMPEALWNAALSCGDTRAE